MRTEGYIKLVHSRKCNIPPHKTLCKYNVINQILLYHRRLSLDKCVAHELEEASGVLLRLDGAYFCAGTVFHGFSRVSCSFRGVIPGK